MPMVKFAFARHGGASFSACRALIINGIPDLATRGDLADRALVLRLAPLAGRITESDWRARVDAVLPPTFAALLDALSFGLRRLAITPTPDIRMADFARIVVAAEPVLPWGTGEFMAAYRRSRADAGSVLADGDTVASAIRTFMGPSRAAWSGLMSGLYQEVSNSAASEGRKPADWPGDARWFGDRLRRSAPTLRALGIDFRERRTGDGNRVTLERIDALATSATPTAPNAGASDVTRPVASDANVAMDPMRGPRRTNDEATAAGHSASDVARIESAAKILESTT